MGGQCIVVRIQGGTAIFGPLPLYKDSGLDTLKWDMADDYGAHKIDKFRLKIHGSIFNILWVEGFFFKFLMGGGLNFFSSPSVPVGDKVK